jgi:UrcA family protein
LNAASNIRIADSVAHAKIVVTRARRQTSREHWNEWLQETKMFTTARNGLVALVAITATAVGLYSSAHAGPNVGETPAVNVYYGDLDLTSDAGVRVLYRRLQVAAKQVCRSLESHEIVRSTDHRSCYNRALSSAVTKVNLEMLSVLHKNGSPRPRVS